MSALAECWASAARSYSHSQRALEVNMGTRRWFKLLIWIFHFINHILNNSHHSKFLMQLTLFSLTVKPISQRGSAYINQHNLLAGSWWYHWRSQYSRFLSVLLLVCVCVFYILYIKALSVKNTKCTSLPFSQKVPVKWSGQWQEGRAPPGRCGWWHVPPLWQRPSRQTWDSCRGCFGVCVGAAIAVVFTVPGVVDWVVKLEELVEASVASSVYL